MAQLGTDQKNIVKQWSTQYLGLKFYFITLMTFQDPMEVLILLLLWALF